VFPVRATLPGATLMEKNHDAPWVAAVTTLTLPNPVNPDRRAHVLSVHSWPSLRLKNKVQLQDTKKWGVMKGFH